MPESKKHKKSFLNHHRERESLVRGRPPPPPTGKVPPVPHEAFSDADVPKISGSKNRVPGRLGENTGQNQPKAGGGL